MTKTLLFESVIGSIKADLAAGRLGPGSRLPPIGVLAASLGVSPGAVREAYRILGQMAILDVQQGRGTFVRSDLLAGGGVVRQLQLREHTSRAHLLEARKALEPSVAALAARRATDLEVNAILETAERHERALPTVEDWLAENLRFHDLIVVAAHNPVLAQMLAAVRGLIPGAHTLSPQTDDDRRLAIKHHLLIALAIRERNPDAARAFMYQHIEEFEQEAVERREVGRSNGATNVQTPTAAAGTRRRDRG